MQREIIETTNKAKAATEEQHVTSVLILSGLLCAEFDDERQNF